MKCNPIAATILAVLALAIVPAQAVPCTAAQLGVAKTALARAGAALDGAIKAIDKPTDTDLTRLATWLGVRSSADAASVRQVLANSRAFIGGATFDCDIRTEITLGDVYGHVLPDNAFLIALGFFFFKAPDQGFSAKLGVIVHEMTHFTLAGATVDPNIYGTAEAKALATRNPAAARKNAENYEYFVEATAFGL